MSTLKQKAWRCLATFAVAALAACGSTTTPSNPTTQPTATASVTASPATAATTFPELDGIWALTFTVTGYKGPDDSGSAAYPLGSVQKIPWSFDTSCTPQGCAATGGTTNVAIPDESTSFSPANVFTFTTMSSTPLVSSGGGPYVGSYPGPIGCGTETVSITVTGSASRADGPHATSLTGTDTAVGGGACPDVQYVVMQITGTQVQDATPNP